MGEGEWRIEPLASQCDRHCLIIDDDDRLDEAAYLSPQLAVRQRPTCANVRRCHRRAIGELRVLAQGDEPGGAVIVNSPSCRETRTGASRTICADERFVKLAEQQPLAAIGWPGGVRGVDPITERDCRNRFARRRDQ